jgi:Ca2+-binding RTX toxin-like protein
MSFTGGAGNDLLVVTSAAQWAGYTSIDGGAGSDTLRFTFPVTLLDSAFSIVTNFEALVLSGGGTNAVSLGQFAALAFKGAGGAPKITVTGSGSDFTVNVDTAFWGATSSVAVNAATGGVNKLNGGNGGDTFNFDNANDLLLGGAYVDGNGGNDRLVFRQGGTGPVTDAHFAGVSDMEQLLLQGSGLHDITLGSAAASAFTGTGDRIQVNALQAQGSLDLDASGLGGPDVVSVIGSAQSDTMVGSARSDILRGENGDDQLSGGNGGDNLNGGAGNDLLSGEGGNDTAAGGTGDDAILGGAGNDNLAGDDGNDTLSDALAAEGNDVLNGGNGDDSLLGGQADTLTGGADGDTFVAGADTAAIVITDFGAGAGGVLGFDDAVALPDFRVTSEYGALTNYGAFKWVNMGVVNTTTSYVEIYGLTGFDDTAVSGDFIAFSGPAIGAVGVNVPVNGYGGLSTLPSGAVTGIEMTHGNPGQDFAVLGATFLAAVTGSPTLITVEAWDDGVVVGTWSATTGTAVTVDFLAMGTGRFTSVDKVTFGGDARFGIDDIAFGEGEVIAIDAARDVVGVADVGADAVITLDNGGTVTVLNQTAAAISGSIWEL